MEKKIKKAAKELCEKSGCHYKCHDTKDCVVEDEAELLLINENKSNNFEVKSNNELFKQALVEGVNRRIDKDLQIGEMVDDIDTYIESVNVKHWYSDELDEGLAKHLYNAGYRKQSEGEWIEKNNHKTIIGKTIHGDTVYAPKDHCSKCGVKSKDMGNYCSHCGAKMKGGE